MSPFAGRLKRKPQTAQIRKHLLWQIKEIKWRSKGHHKLQNSKHIKKWCWVQLESNTITLFPNPSSKALDRNPEHSKYCHQTKLLWRLIQPILVRSSFPFKWMKFLWEPRKFIKELYLLSRLGTKSGLSHETVSWGFLCLVTSLLKAKELELPRLFLSSMSSAEAASPAPESSVWILSSALGNLSLFLMQR